MKPESPRVLAHSWLLLVHQLPAKPAYLRVKIWRRLQDIGAVAVKNAVHALPMNEETQEDFEWLLREIHEGGGEAFVCEARLIDGLSDEEVRTLFDRARDADYSELAKEAQGLAKSLRRKGAGNTAAELRVQIARLRKRLAEIAAIDFFGAIGRETAEGLLRGLEAQLDKDEPVAGKTKTEPNLAETLRNRVWVTRQGVYADRIASAWLIRRFIDPEARFKFVSGKGYRPQEGELRFDMFEAEYTHEGDACTFEVVARAFGVADGAVGAIGEVVHDIDVRDGKFGRPETPGVERLVTGLALTVTEDLARVALGSQIFDALYEAWRRKRT